VSVDKKFINKKHYHPTDFKITMKTHVTTNIRLGTTLYNDIKNVAFKRGISIAELLTKTCPIGTKYL